MLACNCQKSLMTRLCNALTGSFYQIHEIKLIVYQKVTKKVAQPWQRRGSHRPAPSLWQENGGVAQFSLFFSKVCPALAAFTLCMHFPYSSEVNFSTVWDKGGAECFSLAPTGWHCQTTSCHTIRRQTASHWVHSEKLMCELSPHNFIICPSLC